MAPRGTGDEGRKTGERHAGVVVPYGWVRGLPQVLWVAAHSGAFAAAGAREGWESE